MPGKHREKREDDFAEGGIRPVPEEVTEDISELLAGYALNSLSDDETNYIEKHLPERPAWQWELAGFKRTAGLMAYANEPQQVPVRARAAILARIDALAIESQAEAIARNKPRSGLRSKLRVVRSHVPRVAWAAAVPTTVIAVVFIMASILMQERISDQQDELAQFQQEQLKVNELLLADNNGQQVVELVQSSAAPLARGRLFIDRNDNTAMLVVRDMPAPPAGQVYVVWMLIGSNHDEYAQLGELTLDDLGRGQMILEPPDDFARYPVVRITAETNADIGFPRGPEIMTGGISSSISN